MRVARCRAHLRSQLVTRRHVFEKSGCSFAQKQQKKEKMNFQNKPED